MDQTQYSYIISGCRQIEETVYIDIVTLYVGKCWCWENAAKRQILLNLIPRRNTIVPLPEQKRSVTLLVFLILFIVKLSAAQYNLERQLWVCFVKALNKVKTVDGAGIA